ncbi:hypothetical protein [Winogradskyella ursingii]|uniref:hypothetical protein n=1 Tax=Winogradskyella ursingii TaxID=2686079 RepID=UPI0015C7BDE9|nr:hypothetical protein [Winogradskyella ursingii]
MKFKLLILFLFICFSIFSQNDRISTVETVEILNNNEAEALFYFQNNWKLLREKAVQKNYIHSYQLVKTLYTKETPFHLMLITTYSNKAQYDKKEAHFSELIKEKGALKLLNEKEPFEFRKSVFSVEGAEHLE